MGSTGLSHDLNQATITLAVLGLKRAGLDLNFLDESQIDAGAEGSVDRAADSEATVSGSVMLTPSATY